MTNEFTYEVEFVVPDDVEEENVLLVLREFFGDLIQTDRFIDARVKVGEPPMDEHEQERVTRLMDDLSSEDIEAVRAAIEKMQDGE